MEVERVGERPGWVQDEAGRWRRETIPSMLRRLPGWDYKKPWIYQITLVCADRHASPLGVIEVRRDGGAWVGLGEAGKACRKLSLSGRDTAAPGNAPGDGQGDWRGNAQGNAQGNAPGNALGVGQGNALGVGQGDGRGEVAARVRLTALGEAAARVRLTALGEAVKELFWHFGDYTPEIQPLDIAVMPDHLHFIVRVTREMARPLGNAIGGFKTGCEKLYRKLSLSGRDTAAPGTGQGDGRGTGQGDGRGTGQGNGRGTGLGTGQGNGRGNAPGNAPGTGLGEAVVRLWSAGFQDTILLHEGQLDNMFRYLADNARRRAIKALYPDLFRVVRRLGVDLPGGCGTGQGAGQGAGQGNGQGTGQGAGLGNGRGNGRGNALGAGQGTGVAGGCVPGAKARGYFMALGNRFLLGRPLAQIQVSRRDFGYRRAPKPGGGAKIARDAQGQPIADFATPAFAEKRDALLAAARHGAVLLSPCVSDGEREIARLALDAGLPLVAMKNKGFAPLEKPSGRHFDACIAGRLLLLAPANWPYTPGEKPMTRLDAVAMNRLCQLLAGDAAAEINYHGMKPNDIDALAFAAVSDRA